MMNQKKVLTIQDISCTGRCSITVALPILSACGIETAIIPTSVLSTHTSGFTGLHHRDLTGDIPKILEHWKQLAMHFDAIYVGFLANKEQVEAVITLINALKSDDTIIFVDPAMADEGEMYSILSSDFPAAMRELCKLADVIIPNMNESFLLLDQEYQKGPYKERDIEDMLKKLSDIPQSQVVMTGVSLDSYDIGAASYNPGSNTYHFYSRRKIDGTFCGTGDVFSSVLVGAVVNDFTVEEAVNIAIEYTLDCIERTVSEKQELRYGVDFEQGILFLLQLLGKIH